MSRIGAERSMASWTAGSLLKVAVKAPTGPRDGIVAQTIRSGRTPLTRKTAISIPQSKNHWRIFLPMVERTSALMMALSMEETVSKRTKPATIKIMEKMSTMIRVPRVCHVAQRAVAQVTSTTSTTGVVRGYTVWKPVSNSGDEGRITPYYTGIVTV
jgi:hypothetical protein